jgi:hypothetical protein
MREIDDGETPHRHGDGALAERADAVGTTIAHDIAHRVEQGVGKSGCFVSMSPTMPHTILVTIYASSFATNGFRLRTYTPAAITSRPTGPSASSSARPAAAARLSPAPPVGTSGRAAAGRDALHPHQQPAMGSGKAEHELENLESAHDLADPGRIMLK